MGVVVGCGLGGQECGDFIKGVDFTVTADVVELVKGDLQKVVDCVPDEGLLKFDPGLITRMNSTIELRRPILLSSDGLAKARPVLQCSEQGDAVFNIRCEPENKFLWQFHGNMVTRK